MDTKLIMQRKEADERFARSERGSFIQKNQTSTYTTAQGNITHGFPLSQVSEDKAPSFYNIYQSDISEIFAKILGNNEVTDRGYNNSTDLDGKDNLVRYGRHTDDNNVGINGDSNRVRTIKHSDDNDVSVDGSENKVRLGKDADDNDVNVNGNNNKVKVGKGNKNVNLSVDGDNMSVKVKKGTDGGSYNVTRNANGHVTVTDACGNPVNAKIKEKKNGRAVVVIG